MMNLKLEKELFAAGYRLVAGIDEAGRGPLAGPVAAACVIIGPDFKISRAELALIRDSKKLSAAQREKAFNLIRKKIKFGVGLVDHKQIDHLNIFQATFLAMKKALAAAGLQPDYILLDGKFKIPGIAIPQRAIIKGDDKIFCIAAASIIAKVARDALMLEYAKKYPLYDFEKHKGYGTKLHLEKIKAHGLSPIHRRSYKPCQKFPARP